MSVSIKSEDQERFEALYDAAEVAYNGEGQHSFGIEAVVRAITEELRKRAVADFEVGGIAELAGLTPQHVVRAVLEA